MSFAELAIVAIVGLVVIGPEKLPQTIKTLLKWVTQIKRLISDTRTELEQQLGVDDIRREIHNEQVLESLKALKIAKEQAERETQDVSKQLNDFGVKIKDDIGEEDEGLFGDQRSNHPPQATDNMQTSDSALVSDNAPASDNALASDNTTSKASASPKAASDTPAPSTTHPSTTRH